MKYTSNNQKGFSAVEILIVIVFVGALAFVGLRVMNSQDDTAQETNTPVPAQSEEINNAQDLEKAENDLNSQDLEQLDTTELDEAEADLL